MTVDSIIIKQFKPFIMGKCRCGCNEDIPIRSGDYLQKYKRYHGIKGKNSNLWKRGLSRDKDGYLLIILPKHHFADSQGRIRLHRLVYEIAYNCILLPWIEIHHRDGNLDNNSISNLIPLSKREHGIISSTRNMDDRVCLLCGITQKERTGANKRRWYNYKDGKICRKCYKRELNKKLLDILLQRG